MIRKLKIIRSGYLIRAENGMILDASSTAVLIETDKNYILVDSSKSGDKEMIVKNLLKNKIKLKDITILIFTHAHTDHIGNANIFHNAQIYIHSLDKLFNSAIHIKRFPYRIEEDIEIIDTPGHSWDSISVILKKINRVYAITGDCIPLKNNLIDWIPPIVNVDPEKAIESMKKILKIADIIIPGHDYPFKLNKDAFSKYLD
jgi:glyoxylase-like metal-dependent hydrolase (beta-lactamase superfamily II)